MKEIIIYSNYNEAELFRTLAKYGKNLFGYRVLNTKELVEYCLNQVGETSPKCISQDEQIKFIYSQNWNEKELGKKSYQTCVNIANTINTLRGLIINEDSLETDKKELKNIFDAYNAYLDANSLYDDCKLINYVIKTVKEKDFIINTEIIRFESEKASFIEAEFCNKVFPNYKTVKFENLININREKYNEKYYKCLSRRSEICNALLQAATIKNESDNKIIQDGFPIDECLFVLTDPSYESEVYQCCKLLNIPYTSTFGKPLSDSNVIKVYKAYRDWNEKEYNNIDSLKNMINAYCFDKKKLFGNHIKDMDFILKELGNLKISNDHTNNATKIKNYFTLIDNIDYFKQNYLPNKYGLKTFNGANDIENQQQYKDFINNIVNKLEMNLEEFIKQYTIVDDYIKEMDDKAINEIHNTLQIYKDFNCSKEEQETLDKNLFKKHVESTISCSGKLHITDISSALQSLRKNVFILGCSSEALPIAYKENSYFLDCDYHKLSEYNSDASGYLPVKDNIIAQQLDSFDNLFNTLKTMNSNIYISYSYTDIAAVKDISPSSIIFDKNFIEINNYFASDLFKQDKWGLKYTNNDIIRPVISLSSSSTPIGKTKVSQIQEFEPTKIHKFFQCPFKFFIEREFSIYIDDEDDPFDLIPATDLGTLVHSCMELLFDPVAKKNSSISKQDFLNKSTEIYNNYFKKRIPMNIKECDNNSSNQQYFLNLVSNGYDRLHNKDIYAVEKHVDCDFNSYIIGGFPDCIYKENGGYVIADYKTNSRLAHINNDVKTCMQALIYAYCLDKAGYQIKRVEYYYLKINEVIYCDYNSGTRSKLEEYLKIFFNSIENTIFPVNHSKIRDAMKEGLELFKTDCTYCKIKNICELRGKVKENDD